MIRFYLHVCVEDHLVLYCALTYTKETCTVWNVYINYSQELKALPRYPNEILPLFLYLGERCHAYNASTNYDLKIRTHVSLGSKQYPAYPEGLTELHFDVEDQPGQDLLSKFDEICEFLGAQSFLCINM